jgi:hypothetical protein
MIDIFRGTAVRPEYGRYSMPFYPLPQQNKPWFPKHGSGKFERIFTIRVLFLLAIISVVINDNFQYHAEA